MPTFTRPGELEIAVLVCLATWRITHLLMVEDGPWFLVRRLRESFGVVHDVDDGSPIAHPDGSVFACFLCLSVWVALVDVLLAWGVLWFVLVPFAVSAVAIWAERWYGKK